MNLLNKFFNNTRKPEGFLGRLLVNGMNTGGHARMAEWGVDSVNINPDDAVLDIGCGGGANVARLLKRASSGSVAGMDYSPVSVDKSRKVNAKAIAEGRCRIVEGNALDIPFPEGQFNLVTAFETVYFWPDIETCFAGVRRTLKYGGTFLIVNESDGSKPSDAKWESIIQGMHTYSADELISHLSNAGFADITVSHNDRHHWLAVRAVKKATN